MFKIDCKACHEQLGHTRHDRKFKHLGKNIPVSISNNYGVSVIRNKVNSSDRLDRKKKIVKTWAEKKYI